MLLLWQMEKSLYEWLMVFAIVADGITTLFYMLML